MLPVTALFVELIIIGVGAFTAFTLYVMTVLGMPLLLLTDVTALILAFPFLSFSYVLGIVVDRFADYIYSFFPRFNQQIDQFPSVKDYHTAKRRIRYYSERLWYSLEYTRARLRVCRGWSVNCVLLLIASNVWIWGHANPFSWRLEACIVMSSCLLLLFLGCIFSFSALIKKYRVQVFEKHEMMEEILAKADSTAKATSAS